MAEALVFCVFMARFRARACMRDRRGVHFWHSSVGNAYADGADGMPRSKVAVKTGAPSCQLRIQAALDGLALRVTL